MIYKTAKRTWTSRNSNGVLEFSSVEYTIFFKNGDIFDIRNEFHSSIERGSDCWEHFQRKHKQGLI